MFAKFVVVASLVAVAVGAPAEAPATPLQDLQKHAAEFQKTFTEGLNQIVNSKNTAAFNNALKEGSDSVLAQLNAFSNTLQAALGDASGKAKTAIEQARAVIEKQAQELKAAHPDVEKKAVELKDQLGAAVNTALERSQVLAKEVAANLQHTNEKLVPTIKKAYDDFVTQTQEVQKKLHEAANKQ